MPHYADGVVRDLQLAFGQSQQERVVWLWPACRLQLLHPAGLSCEERVAGSKVASQMMWKPQSARAPVPLSHFEVQKMRPSRAQRLLDL